MNQENRWPEIHSNLSIPPEMLLHFGQLMVASFAPKQQYTVSEWMDYVLDSKSEAGRKRKTISTYRYCASRVREYMGDKLLHEVTPSDINKFLIDLKKGKVRSEDRAILRPDVDVPSVLRKCEATKAGICRTTGIAPSTLDNAFSGQRILRSKAEQICATLCIPVTDLFILDCDKKQLSAATLEDYRRFIRLIFGVAERELQIPYNPATRIEKVSTRKNKSVKVLELDQLQQTIAAADLEPIDKRCLMHLMIATGCRRGELAALRWSGVYWEEGIIVIDSSILYTPEDGVYFEDSTKSGHDRALRLPPETLAILHEYRMWQMAKANRLADRWIDSDFIFTGRYGGQISPDSITSYVRKFQKKYDLPHLYPHKLRHTHASSLLYSGVDIATVSKRLGHRDISTTESFYLHSFLQADIESSDCISNLLYSNKSKK